jgi:hypothetical protein
MVSSKGVPKTLVFGTCPPCPFFRYHTPRSKRSRLLKVNVGLLATLSVDQKTVGVVQQPSPADLLGSGPINRVEAATSA